MAKNKRNKKDRKLRQSLEILKAQLKVEEISKQVKETAVATKKAPIYQTDDKAIKTDLLKTIVLSALAFGVIAALSIFNINPF